MPHIVKLLLLKRSGSLERGYCAESDQFARNVDKFVRFVNLMINDVTYLLDESLSELSQIAAIQHEMDTPEWHSKPLQHRREREGTLRSLERHASGYTTLGRSTVDLLKIFTAETKAPFMEPEIVDRLAAMLDYNLDALAGPRCANLMVKDREKYRFEPRKLLADIIQIYLNLADQEQFVHGVAIDERSYKKELFERAAGIARNRNLKSPDEIEQLRVFIEKVEETRATLQAEEDLGEVPDEYLGLSLLSYLLSSQLTLSRRSFDGHAYARPSHAAIVKDDNRQTHNQITFVVRYQGPIQPFAA